MVFPYTAFRKISFKSINTGVTANVILFFMLTHESQRQGIEDATIEINSCCTPPIDWSTRGEFIMPYDT